MGVQAVVVAGERVLAIEGAEGTDAMLERVAARRQGQSSPPSAGVLAKGPKPGQEMRVDMPVIGTRTVELAAALEAWVAAGPAGAASTGIDGDDLTLHACDPGEAGPESPTERSPLDAITLAAVRTGAIAGAIEAGLPEEVAECYADAVLDSFTVEELTAEVAPADMDARIQAAALACT